MNSNTATKQVPSSGHACSIRQATVKDTALILQFIKELAEYEKLAHEVTATEADITESMFGDVPRAHALILEIDGEPAGFAVYFYNFSTFLGRAGIYLEDIYVREAYRGYGIGKSVFTHLATKAVNENCGRFEWSVLDWNAPAIAFYDKLGGVPNEGWTIYRMTGDTLKALAR